jgi:hypothetical protein
MSEGQQLAPEQQKRTTHNPRSQQAEGSQAKTLTRRPHNQIGERGARHRPRTASEGPAEGQCPHIKAKTPLTRGYACPRWDSNCIPAPANTRLPPKHAQSEPIRPIYGPVRDPKCGHCPHALFVTFQATPNDCRSPHQGCDSSIFCRKSSGPDFPTAGSEPISSQHMCRLEIPHVGSSSLQTSHGLKRRNWHDRPGL